MKRLSLVLVFLLINPSFAAFNSIIRGPYLQNMTSDSVVIRWRTEKPNTSVVKYWTNKDDKAKETNLVLSTEHEIKLDNLKPNTKYFYTIQSREAKDQKASANKKAAPKSFFITAPDPNADYGILGYPLQVWVLGDPGSYGTKKFKGTDPDSQLKVRDAYLNYRAENNMDKTDLILTLGDNAYADGTDAQYQTALFGVYKDILTNTPMFTTFGNHDAGINPDSQSYNARSYPSPNGVYYDNFSFPGQRKAYYSFNYGRTHFVVLDSYDSLWEDLAEDKSNYEKIWTPSSKTGNAMLDWLKKDLATDKSRWTIVAFHHPPYGDDNGDHPNDIWKSWMKVNVVPILEEHKVDLVLCGHIHNYQRSYPLTSKFLGEANPPKEKKEKKKSKREVYLSEETTSLANRVKASVVDSHADIYKKGKGTIYLVMGSSGTAFDEITEKSEDGIFAVSSNKEGSLILDIDDERLVGRFLSSDKKILDKFTLKY